MLLSLLFLQWFSFLGWARPQTAVYWGQNVKSDKNPTELDDLCRNEDVDIVMVSFIDSFDTNKDLRDQISVLSHDTFDGIYGKYGSKLRNQIDDCREIYNKKVFISLGGETGDYEFEREKDAIDFADKVHKWFKPYVTCSRRFLFLSWHCETRGGIDGFDLNIEKPDQMFYPQFVERLRANFDSSIKISASPQCLMPEPNMEHILKEVYFDYMFIQYYNNEGVCDLKENFNWKEWVDKYPQSKLFVGVSLEPENLINDTDLTYRIIQAQSESGSRFGGVAVWEASFAIEFVEDDRPLYLHVVKCALATGAQCVKSISSAAHRGFKSLPFWAIPVVVGIYL